MRTTELSARMGYPKSALWCVAICAAASIGFAGPGALTEAAKAALSEDPVAAGEAVRTLRAAGQQGVDAFAETLSAAETSKAGSEPRKMKLFNGENLEACLAGQVSRENQAFNEIAGQYDAAASRLFWHTDLNEALERAKRENKPVLSLRMLGKLTDDLSCANSRFFRTVLYANKEVSGYLRDHYVMHWQSVRPVPVIEIDFGDGRRVRRTITGNSAHYILDQNGRVIDALPGVYAPKTFLRKVEELKGCADAAAAKHDGDFYQWRKEWHSARLAELSARTGPLPGTITFVSSPANTAPNAAQAAPVGRSKGAAELSSVHAALSLPGEAIAEDPSVWAKYSPEFAEDAQLDQGSMGLIVAKNPRMAMKMAVSKGIVETPMMRMTRNLSRSISEDTAQNEYGLHRVIHEWMAQDQSPRELDVLNERVYAELFLTPSSDPWLGLVPPDTYAALDNEGILSDGTATAGLPKASSAVVRSENQQLQESAKPLGQ